MTKNEQHGFATFEIILVIIALVLITGFAAWRIASNNNDAQKNLISGPLTSEDRLRLEELAVDTTTPAAGNSTATTDGPSSQNPNASTNSSSNNATSSNTQPTQSSPQSTSPAQSPPTSPSAPATTAPSNRPTTEFCKQKDGASFTNVWAVENATHTYQVWENGGWVNKSETGTAARNYDTMQIVGIIPYVTRAAWATCSDKAGYIMFYYQPSGSVYTYNWLVPFEYVSLVQP